MTRRRLAWILATAALVFAAAAAAFAYHAASWLRSDDALIKADAIVVLSGRFERSMHAADLYRAGYAPVVVLSDALTDAGTRRLESLGIRLPAALDIHRQVLKAKGVPAERIEVLGAPVLSTADEAVQIAQRYGQPGRRLIVVTSPSHVMRARPVIGRELAGRGMEFAVSATPYESFPDAWWRSQDAARDVLLEWFKLGFYLLGGRFSANEKDGG